MVARSWPADRVWAGGQQGRNGGGATLGRPRLFAHPPRQSARTQGHAPEQDQGQNIRRRPDQEAVARLEEQEVVGQKGQSRRRQSGPEPVQHPRRHHRRQIDDAQIDPLEPGVQQQGRPCRRQHEPRPDRIAAPVQRRPDARPCRRFGRGQVALGHHVDGDPLRLAQQFGRQGPAGPFGEPPAARLADDDLGDVVAVGVIQHGAHHVVAADGDGPPAQLIRQLEGLGQPPRRPGVGARSTGPFDVGHGPGGVHHHVRHPPAGPHQGGGHGVPADQDQDTLVRRPRPRHAALAQMGQKLVVNRLGRAAQGQFAQGRQILDPEEVLGRHPRRLGHIDLALGQTRPQVLGRDVDDLDVVGAGQDAVGNGLALAHAGNAQDDVGQALQMLDVQRGPDVDPGVAQLLHVLPPLGMARTGRVGMGVFVHQQQFGPPRQGAVQIELHQGAVAVFDGRAWHDVQPAQQAHRLLAAVGLDHADDDIQPLGLSAARGAQHLVGLAHAGRHAQKHLQPPALAARNG